MTRLIDVDAFKKILSEHEMQHDKRRNFDDYSYGAASAYEYAGDLLDEQPTVEIPHGEWIPVEERLPEESGFYLITGKSEDGWNFVWIEFYRKNEGLWAANGVSKVIFKDEEIRAWMPLPEPYKEGDSDAQH